MKRSSPLRVAILGSTGSIGRQTLDVIERLDGRVQVTALAANSNHELLLEQAHKFDVKNIALFDIKACEQARNVKHSTINLYTGIDGICEVAKLEEVDTVVMAMSGMIGFLPTIAAIQADKTIALASKEVLVAGGEAIKQELHKHPIKILPIDSEHSAVFQCLQGVPDGGLDSVILTASGGPFRTWTYEQMQTITVEQALKHPTWTMGSLVTINSATLMNKGLEIIEAHWLFDIPTEKVEVVIHPQSIIHSFIRLNDGSILAQLGLPDMRLPIQYALMYPERLDVDLPKLNVSTMDALTFAAPDEVRFPCLALAREAAASGKTMPAALNGANEAAVELFLEKRISFMEIPVLIKEVMNKHTPLEVSFDSIYETDIWARDMTVQIVNVKNWRTEI